MTKKKTTASDLINLAKKVYDFRTTDEWKNWLQFLGNFYKYSMYNTSLIYLQRPTSTHVAPFRVWKKLGRYVKKGERGIAILVPCWRKKEDESTDDYKERKKKEGASFFVVGYVFDVSQTEGADIPTFDVLSMRESEVATEDLYNTIASTTDYTVSRVDIVDKECGGWTNHSDKTIGIGNHLNLTEQIRALVHEVAHSLFEERKKYSKQVNELVADSVSYSVLSTLGIDSEEANVKYLAGWGANVKNMTEVAPYVVEITHKILKAVNPADELQAA